MRILVPLRRTPGWLERGETGRERSLQRSVVAAEETESSRGLKMADVVPHLPRRYDVFERDTASRFRDARYSLDGVVEPFLRAGGRLQRPPAA